MDTEGLWSVTPEVLANHQSQLCKRYSGGFIALDAMAGCGGNAIAMGRDFSQVYAVEISSRRADMIRHNAAVYAAAGGKAVQVRAWPGQRLRLANVLHMRPVTAAAAGLALSVRTCFRHGKCMCHFAVLRHSLQQNLWCCMAGLALCVGA